MARKVVARLVTIEEKVEGVKEIKSIRDLTPDDKNFNKGTERGAYMVDQSLASNGAGRSILVDRRGKVIAGNKTLEAAAQRNFQVRTIRTRGDELVVVQREDLDLDSDPDLRAHKLALDDNRASQVGLSWDAEAMLEVGVPLEHAFFEEERAELLADALSKQDGQSKTQPDTDQTLESEEEAADTILNRAAGWAAEFGVRLGQIWEIGCHRLLVGDCLDQTLRDLLMQGEHPQLANLDPPYGISIVSPRSTAEGLRASGKVGGSKPFGSTGDTKRSAIAGLSSAKARKEVIQSNVYPVMEGDDKPFDPSWLMSAAEVVILWGANYYADRLPSTSSWIVWDKRENITRNSFADCELAWSSAGGPARLFHHLWNGLHKGSQHDERRYHPTEKPVALYEEIGRLYAPDGLWVDYYAGSGSQLVAAERAGARCYAAEIEPLYAAVCLYRLRRIGLEPKLIHEAEAEK